MLSICSNGSNFHHDESNEEKSTIDEDILKTASIKTC